MTKQSINPPKSALCDLIADNSFAAAFQTMGQYRAALLRLYTTHPTIGAGPNDQITAGSAIACECGKPLGRNVAINVHDEREQSALDCAYPNGDGSLRWSFPIHTPAGQERVLAMELFATVSTSAHQICRNARIEPDSDAVERAKQLAGNQGEEKQS